VITANGKEVLLLECRKAMTIDARKRMTTVRSTGILRMTRELETRTSREFGPSASEAEKLKTLRQVDINKLATDPEEKKCNSIITMRCG
jgi:hypothetical protein